MANSEQQQVARNRSPIERRSREARVEERASPLHATNWLKYLRNWHDNRITWLCTVVARDPDAHPLIPSSPPPPFPPPHCPAFLSSLSLSLSLFISVIRRSVLHDLPYKRQIRVIKRPVAGHAHCFRRPCNFRFDVLPVLLADHPPIRSSRSLDDSAGKTLGRESSFEQNFSIDSTFVVYKILRLLLFLCLNNSCCDFLHSQQRVSL